MLSVAKLFKNFPFFLNFSPFPGSPSPANPRGESTSSVPLAFRALIASLSRDGCFSRCSSYHLRSEHNLRVYLLAMVVVEGQRGVDVGKREVWVRRHDRLGCHPLSIVHDRYVFDLDSASGYAWLPATRIRRCDNVIAKKRKCSRRRRNRGLSGSWVHVCIVSQNSRRL